MSGWVILALMVLFVAGIISCAPANRYKMLSFFFDGVPPPEAGSATASPAAKSVPVIADTIPLPETDTVPGQFYHYPYQEQYCSSCHDENSKGEMIDSEPALCYNCHEDFSLSLPYLHGPVSGGFCTECHNPHMADNKMLLIRRGQKLCLYCHDTASLKEAGNHENLGEMDCAECHKPHGGEDRFMFNW